MMMTTWAFWIRTSNLLVSRSLGETERCKLKEDAGLWSYQGDNSLDLALCYTSGGKHRYRRAGIDIDCGMRTRETGDLMTNML